MNYDNNFQPAKYFQNDISILKKISVLKSKRNFVYFCLLILFCCFVGKVIMDLGELEKYIEYDSQADDVGYEPFEGSDDDACYVPPVAKKKNAVAKKKRPRAAGAAGKKKNRGISLDSATSQDLFQQDESGDDGKTDGASSVHSKSGKMSREEKIQMVGLVQVEEAIWNSAHKLHSNSNAILSAWKRVAEGTFRSSKFPLFHHLCDETYIFSLHS